MTIVRRPAMTNETLISELINKGGKVPSEAQPQKPAKPAKTSLILRIRADVIQQVEINCNNKPIPISRQTWIQEAIIERLNKDREVSF